MVVFAGVGVLRRGLVGVAGAAHHVALVVGQRVRDPRQRLALGEIEDIWALRRVVEASFPTDTYLPETDGKAWDEAYERYLKLFG